jgi:excisionase family DNA binding protein
MTVAEAAKRLEVSPGTVYGLCASGQLAHERIGTGRGTIRISPESLDAFRESARAKAEAMVRRPAKASIQEVARSPHLTREFHYLKPRRPVPPAS